LGGVVSRETGHTAFVGSTKKFHTGGGPWRTGKGSRERREYQFDHGHHEIGGGQTETGGRVKANR